MADTENSDTTKLTLEAERAIRAYLLKLVLPSGAILVGVSFVLGFLIQHGAQNQAAKETFQAAIPEMLKAVADVEAAKNDARRTAEELKNVRAEAEVISGKIKTADAFTRTETQVKLIAEALAARPDFLAKVTRIPAQVSNLQARIDQLSQSAIKEGEPLYVAQEGKKACLDGGSPNPPWMYLNAACPDNTFTHWTLKRK